MKLYKYFVPYADIFSRVTELSITSPIDYEKKKSLLPKAYDYNYYQQRIATEDKMRDIFIAKGGRPQTKHPYYLTLGRCDKWFYGKKHCYGSVAFELEEFNLQTLSFTYGDSIPTFMDEFDDGKEYRKQVYTLSEIQVIVEKYGFPQSWNTFAQKGVENYIEVQVWSETPISDLRPMPEKTSGNDYIHKVVSRMIIASPFSLPKQYEYNYCLEIAKKHRLWMWLKETIASTDKSLFPKDPIHGFDHGYKCAIMAFIISSLEALDEVVLKSFVISALYHDIGRVASDGFRTHGEIGAEIAANIICDKKDIDVDLVLSAIRDHDKADKHDDIGFLKWLRDVDTLDYLRLGFGGFNHAQIRNDTSKKLVQFSLEHNAKMLYDTMYTII